MTETMLGAPLSAFSLLFMLAVMWVAPLAFYVIVFSVGSGLGSDEESETVHPIGSQPKTKREEHHVPRAA